MNDRLRASRVADAFCNWPTQPASTGDILRALNALYALWYQDGVEGRLAEGEAILRTLMEASNG